MLKSDMLQSGSESEFRKGMRFCQKYRGLFSDPFFVAVFTLAGWVDLEGLRPV